MQPGHIGFTVPDVQAALNRVKSYGYEIIKPLDEAEVETMAVPPEVVEGAKSGVEGKAVDEGYKNVFRQLAFVRDPDVSLYMMK